MSPITNTILYYIVMIMIFLFPIIAFLYYDNSYSRLQKLKKDKQNILQNLARSYKKKKKSKTRKEKKKLKLDYYATLDKTKASYNRMINTCQTDYYIAQFAQLIVSLFFIVLFWGDFVVNTIHYIMGYRRVRIHFPISRGRGFTLN